MNYSNMTLQEFFAQCDDSTLDYIENSFLPQMIHIDKLYKTQSTIAELSTPIGEVHN